MAENQKETGTEPVVVFNYESSESTSQKDAENTNESKSKLAPKMDKTDMDHSDTSSHDARISCLGRVTWLDGGESEIDAMGDDDEDDGDEDEDESVMEETLVAEKSMWRWLVVLGSMIIHMIADGICFSYGVLLYRLKDEFNVSKDKAALVGSLLAGVPLFMGPVCSILVNKFSCRSVTFVGGLLTALGFFLSSFVTDFNQFYFTIGLMAGLGLSLVYVPAVVIVAYYFDENRSLATGLAVSGTGIGYAIFAPCIDIMLERFNWVGTMRILAACFLVISVCGLTFRPIGYQIQRKEKSADELERIERKKQMKMRKMERLRMRRQMLDDSRLPSRMSSMEKLERFIKHMEMAELEEAEAFEAAEEEKLDRNRLHVSREHSINMNASVHEIGEVSKKRLGSQRSRYTSESSYCDEDAHNSRHRLKTAKLDPKFEMPKRMGNLINSFSLAALPSFYLGVDNDKQAHQLNHSDNGKSLKKAMAKQSAQKNSFSVKNVSENSSVKSKSPVVTQSKDDEGKHVVWDMIDHEHLLNALKRTSNPQVAHKPLIKRHTETANLHVIPETKDTEIAAKSPVEAITNEVEPKNEKEKPQQEQEVVTKAVEKPNSPDCDNNNDNNKESGKKGEKIFYMTSMLAYLARISKPTIIKQENKTQPRTCEKLKAFDTPLSRKDIFYRGSLMNIRRILIKAPPNPNDYDYFRLKMINGSIANPSLTLSCPNLNTRATEWSSDSSLSSIASFEVSNDVCSLVKRACKSAKHLLSFNVLKNPAFLLFGFANFIFYMWHEIPMMFIRDYTDECKCMERYLIWILLICCGLANAVGQWIYGYLGDKENVNEKILYAVSTIICGFTVVTIPLMLESYSLLVTNQILFGIFLSANYVLNSIILVEIVGVDKLTDAYGMLLLLQGFALVIGSPIAGWIGDITKNYNNTFYYSGVFIILSGIILMFLPLVERIYKRRLRRSKKAQVFKKRYTESNKSLTSKINYFKEGQNDQATVVNENLQKIERDID